MQIQTSSSSSSSTSALYACKIWPLTPTKGRRIKYWTQILGGFNDGVRFPVTGFAHFAVAIIRQNYSSTQFTKRISYSALVNSSVTGLNRNSIKQQETHLTLCAEERINGGLGLNPGTVCSYASTRLHNPEDEHRHHLRLDLPECKWKYRRYGGSERLIEDR